MRNQTKQRRAEKNSGGHFAGDLGLAELARAPADETAHGQDDEHLQKETNGELRGRHGLEFYRG